MIKKEFLNLNQSPSSDKNGYQGIWKFSVIGKGGPKDLKSGPVVPPINFWKKIDTKGGTTGPDFKSFGPPLPMAENFQMHWKPFLSVESDCFKFWNSFLIIWKRLGIVTKVSIFFKSCCNYPETFSNDQKRVSELKPITFVW